MSELGINTIELLPMADFSGNIGWGYGDTHHMVIHSAAGGRDKYRYFVRECHRRGIAVIQDVVYNHYDQDAERAQLQYDSEYADQNIYYWYEGTPFQYSSPNGGYLDNGSTGYTPNFKQAIVRQQFISSAAFLLEEMHVDGLRVDLTQAIHRDNKLHADGREIAEANLFGQKFFREWSRTLKMIRPSVMLIAEDHSGWDAVTKVPADGGLGFDAAWNVYFYHSLIGDSDSSGGHAKLLKLVGGGTDESLRMDEFAEKLFNSQYKQVVYHESHDEAGNAGGSSRTLRVAVAQAPLWGDTRIWAEMRARVVFGLSILSAGTPMFFMGEEIAAQKQVLYNNTLNSREDLLEEKVGGGSRMFRYYQDIIQLSKKRPSIRSRNIDILHVNNNSRVIAFKRYDAQEQILVIASFNNQAYVSYQINSNSYQLPTGLWKEIFNSNAELYGGTNMGNAGAEIPIQNGSIQLFIPANSLLILIMK